MSTQAQSSSSDDDIEKQLRGLSTCDISDALVKLGIEQGGPVLDLECYSPSEGGTGPLVGRAFTVNLAEADAQMMSLAEADARGLPKIPQHHVDECPSDRVIVINTRPEGLANAVWGGLMSTAAQAKGIRGAIIAGRIRDLAEHRELGFPVWAYGHATMGTGGKCRVVEMDVPIAISAQHIEHVALVHPGDWVVADLDGVVVVPYDRAAEVIGQAERAREADEKIRADLLLGRPVGETMKRYR